MSEILEFGGQKLTASKKAAELSGYAQDYIGQLARKGLIAAERVGNTWYVSMDSLLAYKTNAESHVPVAPVRPQVKDADSYVSFDGRDYISASRGAKLTGYNQDYVGQLARAGKVLSRQIGNRWYVDRESLLEHKKAKDAMLAAVQSQAAGIARTPEPAQAPTEANMAQPDPHFRYFADNRALLPILRTTAPEMRQKASPYTLNLKGETVSAAPPKPVVPAPIVAAGKKPMYIAAEFASALTIVVVLSYGFVSLKDSSVMAYFTGSENANGVVQSANAAVLIDQVGAFLESLVVPELHYERSR